MNKRFLQMIGAGMLAAAMVFGPVQPSVMAEESSITVAETSHELVSGKMKVSFDVRNGGSSTVAGFVVVGYDEKGKALEVVGDSAYLISNEIETFEVNLESGSKVKDVKVFPAKAAGSQAVLLESGYRTEKNSIKVTGAVQNADASGRVGMLVVGYDGAGKAVEVKSASSYLTASEVATFEIPLTAVKLIKDVKVMAVDSQEDAVKLLQTGSRVENGKLVVSGAIQNRDANGKVGVIVVGSNSSGKVLEVNTTRGYLTAKEIGNFEAKLDSGKAVTNVKVYLTGSSEIPKIIAEGRTRINNKLVVTTGIENGATMQKITVKSTAYDAKGRLLGTQTDSLFMSDHDTTTFKITYDSRVSSVKLKYYDESGNEIGTKPIRIKINGQLQSYAQAPVMVNGSVLVPMRPIFESLQASVKWDQKSQTVTSVKGAANIKLKMGSKQATVNGKAVALDSAPRSVKGTTMVPLRFVAAALGCEVKWDKNEQMVLITTK